MNNWIRASLAQIFLALCCAQVAGAATVFQDGFESGALSSFWTVSTTVNGRAIVRSDQSPFAGQWHLVLDDSLNDAVYSVAEAGLLLDLSYKKNVVLSFKAKSLGNEPHTPPSGNFTGTRAFDGVSISTDGGTTWRVVQSLATVGTTWESFSVTLDSAVAALGGSYGSGFRIRFSEYDNSPAPLDGIAIDEVVVTADEDQRASLDLPSPLMEGSAPVTGYVLLAFAPSAPLTLNLSNSPAGQLQMPASVTIPAGETFATFEFSVVDDASVNLTRTVTVNATATGVTSVPSSVVVYDNEALVVTLTLPSQLAEGVFPANNASVSIDRAATVALTLTLTANPSGEVTLPSSVTIPAGQTQVAFTARAIDDTKIDGNVLVTVTASASGVTPATAQTTTIDNETRTLTLTLPTIVQEAGTATGTVAISGTLTAPLDVSLTSSNAAALTAPATVTIPAGLTQATFTMTAVDNAMTDGSRIVTITAAANTFPDSSRTVTVRDNDVAAYRFGTLTDIVTISSPVSITVSAADVEGNVISGFAGSVNLSVVLPDGSTQALTPASVSLSGATGWTGTVALPAVSVAPLRLRATDAGGKSGESTAFDIMRVVSLTAADLAWDAARGRIYASVPSTAGAYANQVVTIDSATAQITGGVTTGQDPRRMVLTSDGQSLYVALDANGTVARVNAATMTVASSFAIGTDPSYGTLYAEDISTVAGQPNLLLVSQYRKSVSPRHNGVAAYDNGLIRPAKTQQHTGSNVIEPSADPTIYFGYCTESSEFGFRRLRLDANGMTQLVVDGTLIGGYSTDIRSDGDKVFSTSGVEVDGAQMRRLGTFGVTGPVRPDLAANRVYFVEPQSLYSSNHDKLSAFDPTTFSLIRRLTFAPAVTTPASLIRWGANGLAFRTSNSVVLITSSQLVPSDPPADLATTVSATPNPANVGASLTYTVRVTNQGPNIARNTLLSATLSDSQTLRSVVASIGTPTTSASVTTLPVGDLAVGASATLTITTSPQSAGSLTCSASANSTAVDPNFTDNTGFKLVSVGFQAAIDIVNQLRLNANNLIWDPTRNVLWASIPATVEAPLGRTVVSINPANGLISDPLPINASPMAGAMALSANGRYLYIGLSDVTEVCRIDLNSSNFPIVRVPLGLNGWGGAGYAADIEPLDGDGTSILVTTTGDESALVIDGTTRRANRTGIYTVNRIERTATPNIFVGYDNAISSYPLTRLSVTASGVSVTQTVNGLVSGFSTEIRGAGNLVLSSGGQLVDSSNLTLKANFAIGGRPSLDGQYPRAYLVNGNGLRGFDTTTYAATGVLPLPTASTGDWALNCVRWGLDGFAILGNDSKIYIARWSATIPATADSNSDGVSDAWESSNFNTLNVNLAGDPDGDGLPNAMEYLFGTSPLIASANPVQFSASPASGSGMTIRLVFPRRVGVASGSYGYEISTTLANWSPAQNVTENVLSTQTVNGVQLETVEALIPSPGPTSGFARLKWLRP